MQESPSIYKTTACIFLALVFVIQHAVLAIDALSNVLFADLTVVRLAISACADHYQGVTIDA